MRAAIIFAAIVLLGAGCTDTVVFEVQSTTDAVKTKAAEISATFEKAKAIYDILYPASSSTPSAQPSEDQPQQPAEENTSSQ